MIETRGDVVTTNVDNATFSFSSSPLTQQRNEIEDADVAFTPPRSSGVGQKHAGSIPEVCFRCVAAELFLGGTRLSHPY